MKPEDSIKFICRTQAGDHLRRWVLMLCALQIICLTSVAARAAPTSALSGPSDIPTPTYAEQVIELINSERSNAGRPPLKRAAELDLSSGGHSHRMATADFFGPCDLETHTKPWDRMTAAGYAWNSAGENIAAGYTTPSAAVATWMASPVARNSILSTVFRETGVGYSHQPTDQNNVAMDTNGDCTAESVSGPFYHYWVQDFGMRASVWPLVIAGEAFQVASLQTTLFIYTPTVSSQMRFSNDGLAWSPWQPFTTTQVWNLSPGSGLKTVYAQVYNGAVTYVVSDTVYLNAPGPAAVIVGIGRDPAPVLTWEHQTLNLWYDVYRSTTNPYFIPGTGDAVLTGPAIPAPWSGSKVTFHDISAVLNGIYFYVVRAVAGDGETTVDSNRISYFAFGLVAGD